MEQKLSARHEPVPGDELAWIEVGAAGWSPGVFSLLGLPAEHVTPSLDLFMSFVHPEDQFVREVLASAPDGRGVGRVAFRIIGRDGEARLLGLLVAERNGDQPRWIGIVDRSASFAASTGPLDLFSRVAEADGGGAGLWWAGGPFELLSLSPAACAVLRVGRGERITFDQLARQIPAAEREAFLGFVRGVGISGRVETHTVSIELPGAGSGRHLELSMLAERDERGVLLGCLGTVTDVTDRLRAAERSRAAEALLDRCLHHVADGVVLLDRRGGILRLNDPARRMLGTAEGTGRTLWEVCPSLASDRIWRLVQDAADHGTLAEEERIVPALARWVSYSVSRIGECVLLTLRDRDESFRMRAMLLELSERCATAFRWGKIAVWELDLASEKLWIGDAARGVVGSGLMSFPEFRRQIVPEDQARLDEALRKALVDREEFAVDFRLVRGEGELRRLLVRGGRATGTLDPAGRLVGVSIAIEGVSRTVDESPSRTDSRPTTITGGQVRAARGALRWSVRELAERSDVSVATINRFEAGSRSVNARDSSVAALHRVLAANGIGFFVTENGQPAIAVPPDGHDLRTAHEAPPLGMPRAA